MGLRDMLKKKDRLDEEYSADQGATVGRLAAPEFTFIRSDTHSQEVIYPPPSPADASFDGMAAANNRDSGDYLTAKDSAANRARRSLDVFRSGRSRGSSLSSVKSETSGSGSGGGGGLVKKDSTSRRLSHRLHLSRAPSTSEYVPENLPQIRLPEEDETEGGGEIAWENRATILAEQSERVTRSRSVSAAPSPSPSLSDRYGGGGGGSSPGAASPRGGYSFDGGSGGNSPYPVQRNKSDGVVSSRAIDEDIQEAIRLHEEGRLEESTRMFGRLADPNGANNPLSQVLYGLALRHGWGCEPNLEQAVIHLSAAASNAAEVENMALKAGLKKGGAAKGELVLAIFELANCFRHGWGVPKDAVAAKQYYETAANLGDSDAMNEVAWCYLQGFGCKKDKYLAAKYYRLAEQAGNKTLGNTWIWKDKYNPDKAGKK